jgi:hypothetical protein
MAKWSGFDKFKEKVHNINQVFLYINVPNHMLFGKKIIPAHHEKPLLTGCN